jgi:hypothetical protein
MLHVRYGKAKRGQPPRRRSVASVMDWAVDAVAERLSLKVLMALDILNCPMNELIEPVAAEPSKKTRAASGGAGVGDLRPERARISPIDR